MSKALNSKHAHDGRQYLQAVAMALQTLAQGGTDGDARQAAIAGLVQAMRGLRDIARAMDLPVIAEHARLTESLCSVLLASGTPMDADTHRLLLGAQVAQCRIFEGALRLRESLPHAACPSDPVRRLLPNCHSCRVACGQPGHDDEHASEQ